MTTTNGIHKPASHEPETLTVLPQRSYLLSCMTALRSSKTDHAAFADAFDNVATQLIAAGTGRPPCRDRCVYLI